MALPVVPIVDSEELAFEGQTVRIQPTITKDGATYDLTGKTVTASIRRQSDPYTSLGAAYDDQTCTHVTPLTGITRIDFELVPADFDAPADPRKAEPYLVEFYVSTDDYYAQKVRIHVARSLRE